MGYGRGCTEAEPDKEDMIPGAAGAPDFVETERGLVQGFDIAHTDHIQLFNKYYSPGVVSLLENGKMGIAMMNGRLDSSCRTRIFFKNILEHADGYRRQLVPSLKPT